MHLLMSFSSPAMAGLSILVAIWYYQADMIIDCALSICPFALLSVIGFASEMMQKHRLKGDITHSTTWPTLIMSATQLHVPYIGAATMWWVFGQRHIEENSGNRGGGGTYTRLRMFLFLKIGEMVVVCLPLGILHSSVILRELVAAELPAKLDDVLGPAPANSTLGSASQGHSAYAAPNMHARTVQIALVILASCMVCITGTNSESYRFWFDPRNPWMRLLELVATTALRLSEAVVRIGVYALLLVAYDVDVLLIAIASEVCLMVIISGSIFTVHRGPQELALSFYREVFDLCGTFNGFSTGGFSKDDDATCLLGKVHLPSSMPSRSLQGYLDRFFLLIALARPHALFLTRIVAT